MNVVELEEQTSPGETTAPAKRWANRYWLMRVTPFSCVHGEHGPGFYVTHGTWPTEAEAERDANNPPWQKRFGATYLGAFPVDE
jgi:hypothetical protein